jgi:threonine dehydratase
VTEDILATVNSPMDTAEPAIGLDQIRAAAAFLRDHAHRTPILTSRTLDAACGAAVFLKCENLQRAGAFKFRGAMWALRQCASRPETAETVRRAGVVTHSSGNHAQALSLAGRLQDRPVCVVMPRTAPAVKRAATEGYGARIVLCEPTLASREATLAEIVAREGCEVIHPYDNWDVIAGQGTAAVEMLEQAGALDTVLTPVGGGGLLSGTALAIKGLDPRIHVIGAEPAAADDAARSLRSGSIQPSHDPKTVADGLRTSLGPRPFSVIRRLVDDIVTVTEAEILDALRFVWERVKIVIEPSSAVPVAALLAGRVPNPGHVGIILSGGNIDTSPLIDSLRS